jgi:hypothetical protein
VPVVIFYSTQALLEAVLLGTASRIFGPARELA